MVDEPTNSITSTRHITAMDYYGYMPGGASPYLAKIVSGWKGPYMGQSQNRGRTNRGSRSGVVKVRLPDVYERLQAQGVAAPELFKYSVVDWPADVWGSPYVFYGLRSTSDVSGQLIPAFVTSVGQDADYLNAIVSYGRNRIPGGNSETNQPQAGPPPSVNDVTVLIEGALFIEGDVIDPGSGVDFTLRVMFPGAPPALAVNVNPWLNDPSVYSAVINALKWPTGTLNRDLGRVGMLDEGTDDIVFKF